MSVKLRMTRLGRRHRPFFRINAIESREPRDGRILEKLGHYDPLEKDPEKQVVLNLERVKYWLDKGAIPSDTISDLLLRKGIKHKYAEERAARREKARGIARAKGKFFTKADKIAAEKEIQAEEEKVKAKADAKAAEEKAAEEKTKAKAESVEEAPKTEEKAEEEPKAEEKTVEEKPEAKEESQAEERRP